jgi:hypothetical protein
MLEKLDDRTVSCVHDVAASYILYTTCLIIIEIIIYKEGRWRGDLIVYCQLWIDLKGSRKNSNYLLS